MAALRVYAALGNSIISFCVALL